MTDKGTVRQTWEDMGTVLLHRHGDGSDRRTVPMSVVFVKKL